MLHTKEKIIKNKVGLLNLAKELGNISQAYKIMGFSQDTFFLSTLKGMGCVYQKT